MKKVTTAFSISPDRVKWLKAMAKKHNRSVSNMLDILLEELMNAK